ncbi:MAG: 2-C-methyl-D-erythritol 4-phosphate cytidylyltransferase [Bacteroidales bacterium]|nr:2-C-methyl-D-erythritol 4-phosphate cytidylyltransferase [Bacteroidales bacterium]
MERKKYVIFTAAGSGTRMKASEPKQFLLLEGLPVLHRSIFAFVDACPDVNVVTVLPKEHLARWEELCLKYPLNVPQRIVHGGITRFHSVKNALAKVPDGAIVAVHDGVRPLVSAELICRMFEQMKHSRALIPVLPLTDTLKSLERSASGELKPTGEPDPDRSRIFGAQTPQMFLSEELKAAYSLPFDTSFTDDASVASRYGIPLSYIEGERNNIKITTPEDMPLASYFLNLR